MVYQCLLCLSAVCQLFDLFVWGYLHLIGHFAGGLQSCLNHDEVSPGEDCETARPEAKRVAPGKLVAKL
jgi:hypothetical protein